MRFSCLRRLLFALACLMTFPAHAQDFASKETAQRLAQLLPVNRFIDEWLFEYVADVPIRSRASVAAAIRAKIDEAPVRALMAAQIEQRMGQDEAEYLIQVYSTELPQRAFSSLDLVKMIASPTIRAQVDQAVGKTVKDIQASPKP